MQDHRPLLLDVDTGVDDAIAIALATNLTTHEVIAITTVAGNVPVDRATENTLKVCSWLERQIPVYRGMAAPLSRPLHSAEEFHGVDGLGGWDLPPTQRNVEQTSASEAIIQIASRYRGEVDFAFVGPLTNLAVALKLEPRLASWVRRLVIMGGAFYGPGNVTAHAEFNIYVDPEAALTVARSDMKATWVGLDVTTQTVLTKKAWSQIGPANHNTASLIHHVCRHAFIQRQRDVFHLHDPLAIAVLADSSIISEATGNVHVSTGHEDRGLTRIFPESGTDSQHTVAHAVDSERFSTMFSTLLRTRVNDE